jgi:hypothetical protein
MVFHIIVLVTQVIRTSKEDALSRYLCEVDDIGIGSPATMPRVTQTGQDLEFYIG